MRILISNDDGFQAPGIVALANALAQIADITVVAPESNRSGASNSLTLENPLRATPQQNGFISVDGTPTDCVHLAITGLLEQEPDMVVSGINAGANLGDDVLYSGTVAAATEGRFLGFPALAISMESHNPQYFETGARVALEMVKLLNQSSLSASSILNINVPDRPYAELRGYKTTRLGHRHKAEPVVQTTDPRGKTIYWVGPAGAEQDAGPGTDFHAIREGYVSVTPIKVDLTNYDSLSSVEQWLAGIC
ncbi:MAG: 5'/3'-nucleotidase SurE [Chromatiales bacterium]|jgi:5'-nucleotidase